jgi:hypothetical protein
MKAFSEVIRLGFVEFKPSSKGVTVRGHDEVTAKFSINAKSPPSLFYNNKLRGAGYFKYWFKVG